MGEALTTNIQPSYNLYPEIITISDNNAIIRSPSAMDDIYFELTKETMIDPDRFRSFIKNAESTFRASREYKAYKSFLLENTTNRCQIMGNITSEDADIELHHNVLGLYDICILITLHVLNTVGKITTFDLEQLLVVEHYNNRVGVVFLSKTAHQMFTVDPDGFIGPEFTIGKWWELLAVYKYGITYEIANKVIKYLKKYQDNTNLSIDMPPYEEMMNYSYYNEYGMDPSQCGAIPAIEDNSSNNVYHTLSNNIYY